MDDEKIQKLLTDFLQGEGQEAIWLGLKYEMTHVSESEIKGLIFEPQQDKITWAPREDPDQPWHPPSLIRVFAVRSVDVWGPKLSSCSEDSDPTERMSRLIWVFAGRTVILLVLSCAGSVYRRKLCWGGGGRGCILFSPRPSVQPSIHPSFRPSVRDVLVFQYLEKAMMEFHKIWQTHTV